MRSFGARRSWHPHRPRQLLQPPIATRPPQCQSRFSTATPSPQEPVTERKMDKAPSKYGRWTKDALIKRILALESKLGDQDQPAPGSPVETTMTAEADPEPEAGPQRKKKKRSNVIDPSKYSTRLVAMKLAYLGKNYGGFEYQASAKVPTIEEELWKAMVKACLIFPENPDEVNWDTWEYSKCGRTDRGVSAFGQVIAVRVRSHRPLPKEPAENADNAEIETAIDVKASETDPEKPKRVFNDVVDELPYPRLLNRLLPPDIRVLAWCPTTPAEFSARHHCRERQYRYFFTQPAYSPIPQSIENPNKNPDPKEGWLDIEAMRAAAKKYEGLHDFRNFCKLDGSKHLQSFERRIFESDIVEVPNAATALPYLSNSEFRPPGAAGEFPKVYYFHVRGSAFLWHQIRCMVAALFLVGQGLEDASVIDRLLDVTAEPRRPAYTLANETPLVLWDCLFPRDLDDPTRKDGMDWVYVGEDHALNAHGATGLVDHVWEQWRERKMDEILAAQLLGIVATQADLSRCLNPAAPRYAPLSQKLFEGGNRARGGGSYVPLLKMARLTSPLEAYDKDARKRGFESSAHMQEVIAQRKAEVEDETVVDV